MKIKFIAPLVLAAIMFSCGGNETKQAAKAKSMLEETSTENTSSTEKTAETASAQESSEEIDPMSYKGVGPISSVDLPDQIDADLAAKGEELYKSKCTACHKIEKRLVGPALKGVTERRSPEWIMNMMLNPENMVNEDPIAKQLLAEYSAPMSNQSLTEEEARAILEYFRTQK
jgi:mono/diheme cytochrome c family protein